jgi:hypothetical protein
MVLILEQAWRDQETHAHGHFAVKWVYFDEDVVVGAFVVAECESS